MATHEGTPLLGGATRLPKPQHYGEGGGVEVCGAGSSGHPRRRRRRFFARVIMMITLTAVGGLVFILSWSSTSTLLQQKTPERAISNQQDLDEISGRLAHNGLHNTAVAEARPNVFFIMIDDMGWDDIGYQSVDLERVTPVLDKLAAGGVKMTNYYTMHTCTPARASLMTGRYTVRYGMQYNAPINPGEPWGVPLSEKMLPEYFKEAGYGTHLVGKWHLGSHSPEHIPSQRGFDTYMGYLGGFEAYWTHETVGVISDGRHVCDFGFGNASGYYDIIDRPSSQDIYGSDHRQVQMEVEENRDDGDGDGAHSTTPTKTSWASSSRSNSDVMKGQYSTQMFQERAIEILETKSPFDEEPIYMHLAHQAVHSPLGLPPADSFSEDETLLLDEIGAKIGDVRGAQTRRHFTKVLMFLDKSIGHLMHYLEEKGWMENSIVVVASDNGGDSSEGGSNYPLRGKKASYWEGGSKARSEKRIRALHVPAFVYSTSHIPEARRGSEYDGLMHVTDWLPTLAAGAGLEMSGSAGPLDGVNQWEHIVGSAAAVDGGSRPRTELLYNYDPYSLLPNSNQVYDTGYAQGAFRSGKYKMMFNVSCHGWYTFDGDILEEDHLTDLSKVCGGTCNDRGKCGDETTSDYLFDLDQDPRESNNLIDELPDVAQEMRDRWYEATFREYTDTVFEPLDLKAYDTWAENNWWMIPWLNLEPPEISRR
ncbi:unnamed protein product [Ectocarpus sp. 12 AP-2014]